mmetsp:Transcript_15569/g.24338  ORF Transcript_15569/g.24338 Transcript_15569/m.24338 type:complete len:131 (-) Transcript_15569:181-573(-)
MRGFSYLFVFFLFVAYSRAAFDQPCELVDQALVYLSREVDVTQDWEYGTEEPTFPPELIPLCPRHFIIVHDTADDGLVCYNQDADLTVELQSTLLDCMDTDVLLGLGDPDWCFHKFNKALFECQRYARVS